MWEILTSILFALHIHLSEEPTIAQHQNPSLIVWNVGQGQWATLSLKDKCLHFDMGGEKLNWSQLSFTCGAKQNLAFFSHWDIDHLSFASQASLHFKNFCVAALPRGPAPSARKLKIFSQLKSCENQKPIEVEEIFGMPTNLKLTSNDYSRVFEYSNWLLAQGDSPKRQEKIWSENIKSQSRIRVIILGHHGSRTSTSELLLQHLPNLKMAVASGRMARYGHPHGEVLLRLKKRGITCLRTEYWGNIHIELPELPPAVQNSPQN